MKKRYSSRASVQSTCVLSCNGLVGQAEMVNLSVPGCLLTTRMKLKVGQYVDLRLTFPTSPSPMQIKLAAVRWVSDGQVGLEFIRMSDADQIRLRWLAGHVEQRKPQANWSEPVVCLSAVHC
ncbi:MAG: PilZ domain-containing protein [Nitrospira sp.]|nr:PilZ domain-containing protein [Nitrospira sp.]ULA66780.1 MAG: PilZ domain-containing protein [Nitrospira sp.]